MQATHNRPGLGLPLACLALVLLLAGRSALEPTGPAAGDPSLRLSATQPSLEVELSGWLLSDPRFSTTSAPETGRPAGLPKPVIPRPAAQGATAAKATATPADPAASPCRRQQAAANCCSTPAQPCNRAGA